MAEEPEFYPPISNAMLVAKKLVGDVFSTEGNRNTVYWRGQWWRFNGTHWEQEENELEIKRPIWTRLGEVMLSKPKGEEPWSPTTASVSNLMEPLKIALMLKDKKDAPFWIEQNHTMNPHDLIVLRNGVLDFRTGNFIQGNHMELFNTWSLPFSYDATATCPTFEKFLDDTFAHDPAGRAAIQEFAGYAISGRTDLQKALVLVGPPGGGKGTLSRTIQQLVGIENVVSPSLTKLGSEFGLSDLIGKPLAVIEDARSDYSHTSGTTVERLLSIIGEDAVSINRKNQSYWNGTLPTRFMLVANEVPRFPDASGAMIRRFVAVKLSKSVPEEERDEKLGVKLKAELPGIFNWALAGLKRLEQQHHFTEPETMADIQSMMSDLNSPVANFLDEEPTYRVTGNPSDYVELKAVHAAYKSWCEEVGRSNMNQQNLAQQLDSVSPDIEVKNTKPDAYTKKGRYVFGVKSIPLALAKESHQQSA
ncbi:hypothetical protein KZX32_10945 [Corynebacterium kefirresidentii]|uniref:DNA primase family protein n=1 Tax=Corynebacterium kefirresidentii TaxID=1979527 RepID=UPI002003309C|nr:DNA primase family protein [Corynebacterium kefirresidentii]MCK6083841.1 hypothetical protein [Corynebacterium kefirresidentii]MCK6083985.1 hypothetical protein [Corynebacterium kefirresidentii]MCK6083995.1 hypothetical protein [Corynebacterium kefirresidentii]